MDELRGPNIQIVLHIKEGLGFGFLKTPFVVSGSLNGYMLETDPVVPSHTPVFDAELVWEADKRRFRSLRVQNVPVKIEVYTVATQGRKDKVGYLLLSLLGAQPCPSNKIVDIRYSWHKLLGVKSEGKCCHPQLMMSLSIEDRVTPLTPRNELRLFHSNEIAYPTHAPPNQPLTSAMLSLDEYIAESKRTPSSPDLQPRLLCEEGLIQIGDGKQMFILSFVIGAVENLDLLLPENCSIKDIDCCITYSVFTHDIMTDRVGVVSVGQAATAAFNQRTSLRLVGSLRALARYWAQCPRLLARVTAGRDVGMCSMDLRKLVPTEELEQFLSQFCNADQSLSIHERCHIQRCHETRAGPKDCDRRPYVDVEMALKYVGVKPQSARGLTARSAATLLCAPAGGAAGGAAGGLQGGQGGQAGGLEGAALSLRSGSCTQLARPDHGLAYTNIDVSNTTRYKNAAGDSVLPTNEIAELIKKMCQSFSHGQERPATRHAQVQADCQEPPTVSARPTEKEPVKLETSKSDTCIIDSDKEKVKLALSSMDRDTIMQKFVDELEDWKEKQQELFKCQLKRKEEYHLELLAKEWAKKRVELESKLSRGIEQCRTLAADLSRATDDFRLRGFRNTEREKKLLEAKKALEAHYTAKYQELREASQQMEADMNHRIRLKDMKIEELEHKLQQLDKHIDGLNNNLKNIEKDAENKYSGLTKDQTASLIQELRCLEEKLDSAVQSKAFFKEQWGRAVRELHLAKLRTRKLMMTSLHHERRQLAGMGLDTMENQEENVSKQTPLDIQKLKDDFYVDILANTPVLDSHSFISNSGTNCMDMYEDFKNTPHNPTNERLNELIAQRDRLVQQDNPDEDLLKQLNHEVRNMLLNCGT